MACDRCGECREAGSRFCAWCGAEIHDCPECDVSREEGRRFCIRCGRRVREDSPLKTALTRIVALASLVLALILVMELGAMVLNIGNVWGWASGAWMDVLVLVPQLETAGTISGIWLQLFWIALVLAILASVLLVFRQSLPRMSDPRDVMMERYRRSPLFWLTMLLSASVLLNLIVTIPMASHTSVPDGMALGMEPQALLDFANAAVWEEVIARVAYIGLPMAVVVLVLRRKGAWKCLLGGFGFSRLGLVLLVVSSLVFAFGHMGGWGLWKVVPTFITGMAMGYVYMRFGIHMSIAFHFAVDYMGVLMDGSLLFISALLYIVLILAGAPALLECARRMGNPLPKIREMPGVMPPDQESILSRRD